MNLVPPGAVSAAGRASILSIAQNSQNITHVIHTDGNIAMADAIALGNTGYVPLDFLEAEQQVVAYQPVLCSMLGEEHKMTKMYTSAVKYICEHLLYFKDSLINTVGKQQTPAMFLYIFHKAVQGWFSEQATTSDRIDPPDLLTGFRIYNMRGTLHFLPSVSNVLAINSLSQCSHYQMINDDRGSGGGGGGGGSSGGGGASTHGGGNKVINPNCDPKFKADTVLAGKIRGTKMIKIIEKAKILTCIPVGANGQDRCITYHAKGACMSKCNHAYDHKPLDDTANAEIFAFVLDGCR